MVATLAAASVTGVIGVGTDMVLEASATAVYLAVCLGSIVPC